MEQPIRVLLVDDHPLFRQGVRFCLEDSPKIELAGEAGDGPGALDWLDNHPADLVLMDLRMPGMDGIETTAALRERWPDLPVLMLTSEDGASGIRDALNAGAGGYCLKDAPPEELTRAIEAVAGGGTYLGRGVDPLVLRTDAAPPGTNAPRHLPGGPELTPREWEVLDLVAQGLGNRQIAARLTVSEKTVKTHMAHILDKLDVSTRTQAALWAHNHMDGRTR